MVRVFIAVVVALGPTSAALGQTRPPIVQPGAPGEPSRQISAEAAADLAGIQYSDADVKFMQSMILHHTQALEMTDLLSSRTTRDDLHRLGQRIALSQEDEISMMQDWLRTRGQPIASADTPVTHESGVMPGMLTPEEMRQLAAAESVAFERLFLELMVKHHQGALTMVESLLSQRGTAQDSQLFAFTSDITSDQSMEIDRMDAMLAGFSSDPRVDLAAGFFDAEQAALHMGLVVSLPTPDGFYDPHTRVNDAEVDPTNEQADGSIDGEDAEADEENERRPGLLNFANTDLAFAGDTLFDGNYHGFHAYTIENPLAPQLVSSVVCPGGQGDVSVVGNLLIMSVEQTRGRLDCGLQGVAEPVSAERFRGIRIFDITDARMPQQVAAVQTCRGSHTHTLVTDPDDAGNIYLYGSGTSSVRPGDELDGCVDGSPTDNGDTALFRIDVIQIPVARPEESRIVNRPYIFADPESGAVAGLWPGGDHGPNTQRTRETNQCHDITAYPDIGLAAGACSGNGILLDISDPTNPVRIDEVIDPGFAYWHSATFNNDGTKVIFTDEWGGGGRARCRASDPREWGADAIYDLVDETLQFRSYYKLPAPQSEQENCVAHNGSLIPVPGRDILVQAWYQGGISVVDFTDSSNPVEIAFFDRGPVDPDTLVMGGYWSAYWHKGFIYATEMARGLDVLQLHPSEYLSQSEIDAASLVAPNTFNPQQQRRVVWPTHPAVARAYLAQLTRSGAIDGERARVITGALDQLLTADASTRAATADELVALATGLTDQSTAASGQDEARLRALAETMRGLADDLRETSRP